MILHGPDERLQSVRGLAALMVIFGHALIVLPSTPWTTAIGTIFEQGSAVVFFYVLSGFVLGEALRRDPRLGRFVLRRLTRLLPVFWASLAVGLAASIILSGPPIEGASSWYNRFRTIDTSAQEAFLSFIAISTKLNSVLWSVQIELLVIPLLPVAAVAAWRLPPWYALLVVAILCTVSRALLARTDLQVVSYFYCFFIGLALPRVMTENGLQSLLRNGWLVLAGLAGIATLYVLSNFGRVGVNTKYIVDAFVSAHVLAYIVSSPDNAPFLRHRSLVWIGDRSFSLYAFGQIVLVTIAFMMFSTSESKWWIAYPMTFSILLALLNIALVLPVAWASYRWIELPGIACGKALVRKYDAGLMKWRGYRKPSRAAITAPETQAM